MEAAHTMLARHLACCLKIKRSLYSGIYLLMFSLLMPSIVISVSHMSGVNFDYVFIII